MTNTDRAEPSALLRVLRTEVEEIPSAAQARLRDRLALAAQAAGTGVSTPPHEGSGRTSWGRWRGGIGALAIPASILLGAVGHAWLEPRLNPQPQVPHQAAAPSPRTVPDRVEKRVTVSAPEVNASAQAVPSATPPRVLPSPVRARSSEPLPSPAAAPEKAGLDGDLRLLEQARSELAAGNPQGTMERLRSHERLFPHSPLAEEREALAVRALAAAGRRGEAQRRAERFIARYPQSMLRAAVERAMGEIP